MAKTTDPRKLITDFARDNQLVPALQFIIADPEGIDIKLIEGGGIVNYVYRVQSQDHTSSVIIKYAEERIRLLQEEKVSLDRQDLEYNCLKLLQSIQPGSTPQPYCLDKKHNVLAMLDMSDWELLGDQLEKPRRHVDLEAATQLGRLFSKLHRHTAQSNVSPQVWEEYQTKFKQEELKKYIGEFTFARPFDETDPINKIPVDSLKSYRSHVTEIKALQLDQRLFDLWKMETCFIHGDCHYKSIFVKDGQVALFDFEFAFLCHPAANISFLLACYIFVYVVMDGEHTTDPNATPSASNFRMQCLQAIRNIMEAYMENDVVGDDGNFLSELALFTGVTVFFLSIFSSLDELMEITESDRGKLMDAGYRMMIDHGSSITLDEFMDAMDV